MGKKRMDKNLIENKLANLYDRIDILQEPAHRFFEAIEALVDQPKETDNLELTQFKLELSILMKHFCNEMVDVHDRLIENFEEIEDDLKKI